MPTRRKIDPKDPRELPVQVSLRMPFWQREQLIDVGREYGLSVPEVILDAIETAYPPATPE